MQGSYKTILVALDFSDVSGHLIETAKSFARTFGAKLVLLHVTEPEPEFVGFEPGPQTVRVAVAKDIRHDKEKLVALKEECLRSGIDTTALHIQGPAIDDILMEAEKQHADLIIAGSHGHGALYNLLVGSVTAGLLKSSKIPVLVIPSKKG